MKFFENWFNIKLLLLFNQYKIAFNNPRSMGIDVYKLPCHMNIWLLHSLRLLGVDS